MLDEGHVQFRDDTEVYYVVDRAHATASSSIGKADASNIGDDGVNDFSANGITLSGGTVSNDEFINNGLIKLDVGEQGGYFVATTDNGKGKETQVGEYISIKSEQGNMSSITIDFDSLNPKVEDFEIFAHLFDNGQAVGKVKLDISKIEGGHIMEGSATILSSDLSPAVTFDEVKLALQSPDKGFNITSVEVKSVGDVAIKDSFDYWAVDSNDQPSPTPGTVTIDASTTLPGDEILGGAGLDNVVVQTDGVWVWDPVAKTHVMLDKTISWATSAAKLFQAESHDILGYDHINGAVIDTGIANDTVVMGSGSDTIYLGEGHSPGMDSNVDPNAHDAALASFAKKSYDDGMFDTNGDENSGLKGFGSSNPGLDIAQAGGGNDVVYGEGDQDIIFGGTGHDILDGGSGHDALRGGRITTLSLVELAMTSL
ncbi:calcium-binding protein [Vibrio mexicanus]|uniref:calcium-binding protein n=1 Tax=Vibrio mexicanus TaxID=1004326 RepID=UPI00063C2AC5|nr:calcium-binding protein [Vibrio mexicanus]